jgi:alkanesulfonate monooxygenase
LTCEHTFADVADFLVSGLQRRGRCKSAYRDGALREKLFGAAPGLHWPAPEG